MGSSRFPTYHVPDEGDWYTPGEVVRIDPSSGRTAIVKDPDGDYEVLNCRRATEYAQGPPLLRVGLRKRVPTPSLTDPDVWSTRPRRDW
jgi:hypothetical protein